MKRYIILLFVIIVGFSANDVQKEIINLDWRETAHQFDGAALVFFENTDFFTSGAELPVYTRLYTPEKGKHNCRFSVENPVYEIYEGHLHNACMDKIPEDLKLVSKRLKSGDSQKHELQIVPLVKRNGKVHRLKSFELKQNFEMLKSSNVESGNWKNQSILRSGRWIKISTPHKGIYKIPFSKLREWGFSNPSEVGVFGSGGIMLPENPGDIPYDDLEQNAVWHTKNNGEECLFFYAPGVAQWQSYPSGSFKHSLNDYATRGYFFLGETGATLKEVALLSEVSDLPTLTTSSYDEHDLFEEEKNNILPLGSGKKWYGDKFLRGSSRNYSFVIKDKDSAEPLTVRVNGVARSGQSSRMNVSSEGSPIGNVQFSKVDTKGSYSLYANEKSESFQYGVDDGQLNLTITYEGVSGAEAWLDYIELNYRKILKAGDEVVFFRDLRTVGAGNIVQFEVQNANVNTRIFDVTDLNNLKEVPGRVEQGIMQVKCEADQLREFVVLNSDGVYPEPVFVGEVENQNLHALETPEFLIVSHSDFMSQAEELAAFHRDYDNMKVQVVSAAQVYNEFSSGSKNATGIRNFIKMFYDRGSTLKYVLLFGDGSYDNKEINPERHNFIPTFQSKNSLNPVASFVTDDYYVLLDANESVYDGAIDLGIGRISASTPYEAQLVVDKIKRYYQPEALGDWRNVICFIGDDQKGSHGEEPMHVQDSETLASIINQKYKGFITDKIYLDAFVKQVTPGGDLFPDANRAINEKVKNGVLVLNYIGHANERSLAHENVLDISAINSWSNSNQLPIFVTATCEFSRFDADETSAGEHVLLNPNGGGIGLFSTSRVVYSSANFRLSKSFYSYIFEQDENGEHYRMGDVMRLAKTNTSSSINKRNFTLLADPALKLSYPKYRVITTSINQSDVSQAPDTIGSLQQVTIEGHIADYFGNKQTNFDGELYQTVYDKKTDVETLGNGGLTPVPYTLQENVIYKGRASVNKGDFSFSFVVPKDISYSLGEGKIAYYAHNGEEDAHGAFDNFIIGGAGSEVSDTKGPDIQLFMDSQDFVSGGKTGKDPTLLAYLWDEHGINTVGTGIGHDITAVLDGDYSNVLILNNYYQAEKDEYTSGVITYPLHDLSPGKHTLKLKAWDVANNSSEAVIEFEVSGDFIIREMSNYPNPFTSQTYFVLDHNQADASLETIISIYDLSGRKVDEFQTRIGSAGNSTNPIRWDPSEAGVELNAGIYIYNAVVKNEDGVIVSKSGKMVYVK